MTEGNFIPTLPMATAGPFNVPAESLTRYTTAQLLALPLAESARVMVAQCTDCLSSNATTSELVGDLVYYTGKQWLTGGDKIPPTTDFLVYALSLARIQVSQINPVSSVIGDSPNPITSILSYVSGASASGGTVTVSADQMIRWNAGAGTTSTGSFRGVAINSINALSSGTFPARKIALVVNSLSSSTALSNIGVDNHHWRYSLTSPVFSSTGALSADEIAFVMDDTDALGQGATGTQLHGLVRLNGTTLNWVPSGINPSATDSFLVITWEPNGPGAREGRCRVATATDLGASINTLIDATGSFSAGITSLQPAVLGAKTLGTGSRLVSRRWMKSVTYRASVSGGNVLS